MDLLGYVVFIYTFSLTDIRDNLTKESIPPARSNMLTRREDLNSFPANPAKSYSAGKKSSDTDDMLPVERKDTLKGCEAQQQFTSSPA